MTTNLNKGIALDLLVYQVDNRIRHTLFSGRSIVTPSTNQSVSSISRTLNPSEVFTVPVPSAGISCLAIRTAETLGLVLSRVSGGSITCNINGMFVYSDVASGIQLTNQDAANPVDIQLAFV